MKTGAQKPKEPWFPTTDENVEKYGEEPVAAEEREAAELRDLRAKNAKLREAAKARIKKENAK